VVVAEAAWISVAAGLVQEFVLAEPATSIPELAIAVAVGLLVARWLGPRLGERWPIAGLVLVVGAALIGWLVLPAALEDLGTGLGHDLGANPGGLFLGVAVLRGFAHARFPLAEETVARLLTVGAPGIAIAAIVGEVVTDPYRSRFLGDTTAAAVLFIGASVLALAFTRLAIVGLGHGLDWRRNPSWLGLAVVVLAASMALALPFAAVAGATMAVVAGLAFGPIFIIGLASGLDRTGRRIVLGVAFVATVIYVILRLGLTPRDIKASGSATEVVLPSEVDRMVSLGIGGLLAFLAVVGVLLLVVVWMRRTRVPDDLAVAETRIVDRSGEPRPRRRGWRPHRRTDPSGAVEAYVALLRDIERDPDLRRALAETPAEHARRLRVAGFEGLSLDLLAADYAIARDAGRVLPEREDRRGVERWRRLRASLVGWSKARAEAALAGPTLSREDRDARPEGAREDAVPAGRAGA